MKRMTLMIAIAVFILNACHPKTQAEKNPVPPASESKEGKTIKLADLATNKDVVCGMILEGQSIADTTMYRGQIYGFCATECKAEFWKDPKSYLIQ